jgi:hypothetical protein
MKKSPASNHDGDDGTVSVRMEWGLSLPSGEVVWNEYRGHPTHTPQQRWVLWQVLSKTAGEIGFDEKEFLSRYGWVSRSVTTTIRGRNTYTINDEQICAEPTDTEPDSL